jgi:hypothetical protein
LDVFVDEPGFDPVFGCVTVVFVLFERDVLLEFHGCHTKSAISATTTMTATRLKVASEPPFSRSTVTLRSSIRDPPE